MTEDQLIERKATAQALATQIKTLNDEFDSTCAEIAKECPIAIGTKVTGSMSGGHVTDSNGRYVHEKDGSYKMKVRTLTGEVTDITWDLTGWRVYIAVMTKKGVRSDAFRGEWVRVRNGRLTENNYHNWQVGS